MLLVSSRTTYVSRQDTVGEIVEKVYGLRKRAGISGEFARGGRCFGFRQQYPVKCVNRSKRVILPVDPSNRRTIESPRAAVAPTLVCLA